MQCPFSVRKIHGPFVMRKCVFFVFLKSAMSFYSKENAWLFCFEKIQVILFMDNLGQCILILFIENAWPFCSQKVHCPLVLRKLKPLLSITCATEDALKMQYNQLFDFFHNINIYLSLKQFNN